MKNLFKNARVSGVVFAATLGSLVAAANAQVVVTPPVVTPPVVTPPVVTPPVVVPAVTTNPVPPKPVGSRATYDEYAIDQLMTIASISTGMSATLIELRDLFSHSATNPIPGWAGLSVIPFFNAPADQADRTSGDNLQQLFAKVDTGQNIGVPFLDASVDNAITKYSLQETIDDDYNLPPELQKEQAVKTSMAITSALVTGIAETSYHRANQSMGRLDQYITAIQTSTDLKTSLDLNTRVLVEIAQQNNENLRAMAAMAAMSGAYYMASSVQP
jgi:hypothetical protein